MHSQQLVQQTTTRLERAARNLGRYYIHKAHRMKGYLGFGYAPSPLAPSTLTGAVSEYERARRTGFFRISDAHCEHTIYPVTEMNWAFRFCHDIGHVHHLLEMNHADELLLSEIEAAQIKRELGEGDEYLLHLIETVGQITYHSVVGDFPTKQKAFALAMMLELSALMSIDVRTVQTMAHVMACDEVDE